LTTRQGARHKSGRKSSHKGNQGRGTAYRILRLKFVVPILRSQRPPEYIARGTAIGMVLAFTLTIGLHSILVAVLRGHRRPRLQTAPIHLTGKLRQRG
jgi:uncharacterized protein (DUF2062 family)